MKGRLWPIRILTALLSRAVSPLPLQLISVCISHLPGGYQDDIDDIPDAAPSTGYQLQNAQTNITFAFT
jgi:hypothetical protein